MKKNRDYSLLHFPAALYHTISSFPSYQTTLRPSPHPTKRIKAGRKGSLCFRHSLDELQRDDHPTPATRKPPPSDNGRRQDGKPTGDSGGRSSRQLNPRHIYRYDPISASPRNTLTKTSSNPLTVSSLVVRLASTYSTFPNVLASTPSAFSFASSPAAAVEV